MEQQPRVLIVEDDAFYADLITRRLVIEDIPFMHATTGEEALEELAKNTAFNLILLDISLPGMDGFGVLKHIKQNAAAAKIPVIIMSNFARPEDIEWGEKLGAQKFVDKTTMVPADIADMVRAEAKSI